MFGDFLQTRLLGVICFCLGICGAVCTCKDCRCCTIKFFQIIANKFFTEIQPLFRAKFWDLGNNLSNPFHICHFFGGVFVRFGQQPHFKIRPNDILAEYQFISVRCVCAFTTQPGIYGLIFLWHIWHNCTLPRLI